MAMRSPVGATGGGGKATYGTMGQPDFAGVSGSLNRRSLSLTAIDWRGHAPGHENLVAVCMLIVAGLCMGVMLFVLRPILIPLAVAFLFFYLLQPVVNALNRSVGECMAFSGQSSSQQGPVAEQVMLLFGLRRESSAYMPVVGHPGIDDSGYQDDMRDEDRARERRGVGGILASIRCPRWLSVILAISFAVGVFVCFGMVIYSAILSLQTQWPQYELGAEKLAAKLKYWLDKLHISLADDLVPYIMDNVKQYIPSLLSGVSVAVANCLLVLIFLVYLLAPDPQPLPPGVWRKIDAHVRRYIRLKTFICTVVAIMVGVVLWVLKVPFPGLFALVTFVLQYVPNFGPIVATMLPVPLVVLSTTLPLSSKILSVVLPSTAHFLVGYWLEPRLFGEHLDIHPIVVLLSLAFWSVLWGVPGMILSVPITAILRIVCQHLEHPYARVAVSVLEGRIIDFDSSEEDQPKGIKTPLSGSQTQLHGLRHSNSQGSGLGAIVPS